MNGKAATCPRSKRKLTYNPADLIFSHGTSTAFFPTIRRSGIQPRGEREMQKSIWKGTFESAPELAYLGQASYSRFQGEWTGAGVSHNAATTAAHKFGGEPMMLFIRPRPGDAKNFQMDEDAAINLCLETYRNVERKRLPTIDQLTDEQKKKLHWSGELYYDTKQEKEILKSIHAISDELPGWAMTREEREDCRLENAEASSKPGFSMDRCPAFVADEYCKIEDQNLARLNYVGKQPESHNKFCNKAPMWMKSLITQRALGADKTIPFDRVLRVDVFDTERDPETQQMKGWKTICGGLPDWDKFWKMPEKRRPKSMKVTAQCRREFRKLEGG